MPETTRLFDRPNIGHRCASPAEPAFPRARGALWLLLAALLFAACGREGAPGSPPPRLDDLGRPIPLAEPASRVLTLAPSMTELVYAAGAGSKLVSAGVPDDYPPAVDTLPRHGVYPPDFEAIAAARPELVLATDVNNPRDAEMLEALGIPVVFLTVKGVSDMPRVVRAVGDLLGTSPAAEAAADSIDDAIEGLRERTDALAERPSVLFLVGDDVLYAFGGGTYMEEMIELAGGRSVTAAVATAAPVLTDEFVLEKAPEVIIGPWGEDYTANDLLARHPTWDVVPAVRTGRVYGVPPDLVLRAGPRLVDGAYRMARLLHPDLVGHAGVRAAR